MILKKLTELHYNEILTDEEFIYILNKTYCYKNKKDDVNTMKDYIIYLNKTFNFNFNFNLDLDFKNDENLMLFVSLIENQDVININILNKLSPLLKSLFNNKLLYNLFIIKINYRDVNINYIKEYLNLFDVDFNLSYIHQSQVINPIFYHLFKHKVRRSNDKITKLKRRNFSTYQMMNRL